MPSISELYDKAKQFAQNEAGSFQQHVVQPVESFSPGQALGAAGRGVLNFFAPATAYAPSSEQNAQISQYTPQQSAQADAARQQDFQTGGQNNFSTDVGGLASGILGAVNPVLRSIKLGSSLGNAQTPGQAVGAVGQFGLDSLSAGAAGHAAEQGLGQTLRNIATPQNLIRNAALGYGYGVTGGLTGGQTGIANLNAQGVQGAKAGVMAGPLLEAGSAIAPRLLGAAVDHVGNVIDSEGINHAANTYEADIPQRQVTANGQNVNQNGQPLMENAPVKSYENVPLDTARQLLRKGPSIDPATAIATRAGDRDQGTATIHTDPQSGKIISWSTDTPSFAREFANSTVVAPDTGMAARSAKVAPGDYSPSMDGAQFRSRPQDDAMAANHPDVPATLPPENTGTGSGVKERGFIKTARDSTNTDSGVKPLLQGEYKSQSHGETQAIAAAMTPEEARAAAASGSDAQSVEASYRLAAESQQAAQEASASGDETTAAAHRQQAADYLNRTAENLTTHGQAIEAAKLWAQTPEGQARLLATDINEYNKDHPEKAVPTLTGEQANAIIEAKRAIDAMPEGSKGESDAKHLAQQKLWEHMADQVPGRHTWIDKVLAIRRTGLLTGPKTVVKVLGGHVIHGATEGVSNMVATSLDKVISAFGGQRSRTFSGVDVPGSVKEGLADTRNTLIHGLDKNATYESIKRNRIDWGTSPAGKAIQAYTEGIGRLHQALPETARSLTTDSSIRSQAGAAAENQGLKGPARDSFIKDFIAEPPEDASRIAKEEADHQTFQNKTRASQGLSQLKKVPVLGKASEFIVPFTKVPSAVGTEIINYSPVGAIKTVVEAVQAKGQAGWTPEVQRAFVQGIGRSVTGTALLFLGSKLAQGGIISGQYPTDQKTRNQWELEGKTSNSILLGGKWRSLGALGPSGSALGVGAAYTAGLEGTQKKPGDQFNAALAAGGAALATQAEQPYLQGISQVTDVLKDPKRSALSFAKSTATSFIPTALSTTATATDPLQRQAPDISSALKSKIPVLRETLPAKIGVDGQPVPRGGSMTEGFLDPTNPSTASTNGTTGALSDLANLGYNATPTKVGTSITVGKNKVALTPDQQNALNTQIGKDTKNAYDSLVNDPTFKASDPAEQQKVLAGVSTSIRQNAIRDFTANGNQTTGSTSSTAPVDKAHLDFARQQVMNGTKDNVTLGDNYVTKDASGKVVVKSVTALKSAASQAQYALDLQDAVRSNNLQGYNQLQEQQMQQLDQQRQALLKDPTLNAAALITNQNQQQDIQNQMAKYNAHGYIRKGTGTGSSGGRIANLGRSRGMGKSGLGSSSSRSAPGLGLQRSANRIRIIGAPKIAVKSLKAPKIRNLRKA
jgi:hypothetical protein